MRSAVPVADRLSVICLQTPRAWGVHGPENPLSAGEIAGITLEAALEQVRLAFAERAMPVHATYCPCCHDEERMQRLLRSIPADLSEADLSILLSKSYWTGLNWPELAYYVPEMLARLAAANFVEEDMLFYKLALATRPDSITSNGLPLRLYIGEGMSFAEKEAIAVFSEALLDERLHTLSYREYESEFHELLAFLLRFDSPMAPFLQSWQQATAPQARANLCLLLANYLLVHHNRPSFITGTYYDKDIEPLPENQAALDILLAPEAAANLLMNCVEDAESAGPDWETGIGAAFDWAVTLAQRKR